MSGSADSRRQAETGEEVELVGISTGGHPRSERKTPRRSVQTKLNFYMSHLGRGSGRGGENENENGEEEEEEVGESSWSEGEEGKKKPKRKRKAKPTPKEVPVIGKEAVGFNTGNKNLPPTSGNGSDFFLKISEKREKQKRERAQEDLVDLTVAGDAPCKDPSIYQSNMHPCSESKNQVEGKFHVSATKSTHPFFSRWKTTKRVCEFSSIAEVNKNCWSALDEDVLISCPPIHVSEIFQDDTILLDWGHKKVSERSVLDLSEYIAPGSNLSLECDVPITPLKFDSTLLFLNLSGALLPHEEMHLGHFPEQAIDLFARSEGAPALLADRQETQNERVSCLKLQGLKDNILSSTCTGSLGKLEPEQQDGFHQESLNLHQLHCGWTESSLWTNKYKPDKAVEVCGNTESVRFLNEWLKSWQERHLQTTKSPTGSNICINTDSNDSLYQNDSDSENEDEVLLRNVLLVTGPVGCGKSAAIYACAKEQGFQVIEVNASDERNGAHIKQKFGEAMDSHAIELCSNGDAVDLRRKDALSFMESSVNTAGIDFQNGFNIETSRLCKAANSECPINVMENQNFTCRVANKNIFLFEDVDTVFDEDRGFIATIMQLAETSKRPIILTTNSKNPILPQALREQVVNFTPPSTKDLLALAFMVCAAEEVHASPLLLQRLIKSCQGDIRKTIFLLQFWCQGERGQPDRNMQFTYSPLLCDLDAAHWMITKVIPWAIPCELSLKVEEEISKAISALEENLEIMHSLKEEDDMTESIDASNISEDDTGITTGKEVDVMKDKCHVSQCPELLVPSNNHGDFSDDSDSPMTFGRRCVNHRTDTVLSSQSGDAFVADTTTEFRAPETNGTLSPDACVMQPFQPVDHSNYLNPDYDPFDESANLSRDPFMIAEITSTSHVCDTYKSTCIPESSLVPETENINREGCLSMTVSSGHFSANSEDFLMSNIGSVPPLSQAEVNSIKGPVFATNEYPMDEFSHLNGLDTESVHGNEEPGVSRKEVMALSRGCQLMDECSRADFGVEFLPIDILKCHPIVGSPAETWRKLRNCREDLRSYLTPGQKEAMKKLNLAFCLTDLISEADILLRTCQSLMRDSLEPSTIPFDEPCTSSWCDERLEMASMFSQHGLCFYASKAATLQSSLGYEIPVYLTQEMLTASTSSMALGKLLLQKKMATNNFCTERGSQMEPSRYDVPSGRELESMLCEAVSSIVPSRLYLALKGPAFHEYVAFLSSISKSENSRLSENKDKFRRHQRGRASWHYLRSRPFTLSSEDVEFLARYGCFGEVGVR